MSRRKAATGEPMEGISLQSAILQFGLMSLIFYLWSTPFIQPVKILVVLFHEISHGLMAIASGGRVLRIWISAEEGGACETEGGMPLLIVSAGYLGSMLFGGTILFLSRFRSAVPLVSGFLVLLLLSATVTVLHDTESRTYAAAFAGAFILLGFLTPGLLGGFVLRVVGTISCLYSIIDIYWDVLADRGGYQIENDAVIFSELSGIPAQTVGLAWLVASVVFFLFVLKLTLTATPDTTPSPAPARQAHARA